MALNSDFKVKDSLYVGNSACFVTQTDTPKILSAGQDLFGIFVQQNEVPDICAITNSTGIATFCYDGSADVTVAVDATCNTTWNSAYTTTQANSANWNSAYTWCTTNGDNVIDTVAEGNAQGKVAVTNIANATTQVDVNGLQTDDSPQFTNICMTGNVLVDGSVDGRDIANDGTTLDTLQSLSGDNGLTFASPSQGTLRVTQADGDTTDVDLGVQASDSVGFATICATGNLNIDGTVDSRDVALDGTTTDTLRGLSGANVTTGSSPAQGTVRLTAADGTNTDIDTGLQSTDSVGFATICATGNLNIDGTVDSRDIANDGTTLDALQLLSGANVDSGSSPSQGTVRLTSNDGTNTDIDTGLQTTDSPSFDGLGLTGLTGATDNTVLILDGSTVGTDEIDSRVWGSTLVDGGGTAGKVPLWQDANSVCNSGITQDANGIQIAGGLSATGVLSGDGSCLENVNASSVDFPATSKADLAAGDKFFINDGADKHVTYCALLTDLAGGNNGLAVDASDSLSLKNYANISDQNVPKWNSSTGQFSDSLITETALGNISINGGTTITGNLSVQGELTCIDTTVSVTSALCITNTGTGPALYAEQTGVNEPIAQFVDTEGGQTVIGDTGNVGIGITGNAPGEKLTVSGNLSANGNMEIDGTSKVDGTATFLGGVNFCGVTAGTDNTVLVQTGDGSLATDEIDNKVWDDKLVQSANTSMTLNNVPKVTNTDGTIGSSSITDTGVLVTIDSDTTLDTGHKLTTKASASVYSEEASFTDTVDSTATTVTTFNKTGLKSVKYHVTLVKGVNITTFEVNAVYNGTDQCGTTYAIVDAQAASQLAQVEISSTGSTIDLDITAASDGTTAIIQGTALYS